MEILERDCSVFDCGEEELEDCQKGVLQGNLQKWDEFILSVCRVRDNSNGVVGNASSVPHPGSPSITEQPSQAQKPKSLVVLDPTSLNRLAASKRVGNVTNNGSTVSANHSLPAVAPSLTLQIQRSPRSENLTLTSLLSSNNKHLVYRGPNVRFQAPAPQAVLAPSHQGCGIPVPDAGGTPRNPAQNLPLPSPYPSSRVMNPLNAIGITPPSDSIVQQSAIPNAAGTQEINAAPVASNISVQAVTGNPPVVASSVIQGSDTANVSTPPWNMPLLPETRPEAASDSRPRPRPGPASRTQRLPLTPPASKSQSSVTIDLTQGKQPLHNPSAGSKTSVAPTKEKTFPSLIVTARASLKIFPSALINNERLLMDNQIRQVMQMPAPKFVEYLLQLHLLKPERFCKDHGLPLKLGMHVSPKGMPVSGGYMWIADCCKPGYSSVFSGSIFDKTNQPPANIIKLMYHWACNTAVHNVLSWVKVDCYVMKNYNTFFRAICTAMVHEKFKPFGGPSKKVQVGVISIGTRIDGSKKEVKVDIMAVMDPEVPTIRLKVLENFLSDSNKVYESKFRKILDVLKEWVLPGSMIITDFVVDMSLCLEYGFSNVVVSGGRHAANNNNAVMDYMSGKIPGMFQNTLGMLSYSIIQQFLDELVWRETWGPFPSRAYQSMVEHLAEITELPGPDILVKLKMIASEPTKNWKFSVWKNNQNVSIPDIQKQVEEYNSEEIDKRVPQNESSNDDQPGILAQLLNPSCKISLNPPAAVAKDTEIPLSVKRTIFLESYYYGIIEGNPACQKRSGSFLAECVLCGKDFLSANSFTNHLIHHAFNDKTTLSSVSVSKLLSACILCCKTVSNIDSHMEECHSVPPSSKQSYECKICCIDLKEEDKIVQHMTLIHQELEMPYKCDLCNLQTSIYDKAVSHFKTYHDYDSCVRCPYCFKIVRICTKSGSPLPMNQYYFVQHIQKHSLIKLNRKCEKCALSFTTMAALKQHQEKMHKRSGRVLKKVRRLKLEEGKMLIMPFPIQAPLPPVTLHENSFHTFQGKALSSPVSVPEHYSICACIECDGPMTQNHFSVKMTCTRCSFQSCCANSIREHSARYHPMSSTEYCREQLIGISAKLMQPLHCSNCTYSSSNGNNMATHLLDCKDGYCFAKFTKPKKKRQRKVATASTLKTFLQPRLRS